MVSSARRGCGYYLSFGHVRSWLGHFFQRAFCFRNRGPEYSWSILRLVPGLEQASLYALYHHESVDGSGYPAHLKGSDIPLVARIVCAIDAYDAMISHRCYRRGVGHEEAVRRLRQSSGTQFDADVVQVFIPIAESEAGDVFAAAGTSSAAVL